MHSARNVKTHNDGMNYEIFLNRAFKLNRRIRRANKQEFINLANSEQQKQLSFLPSALKQLEEVKGRLKTAIKILLLNSISEEEIGILEILEKQITSVRSSADVLAIIHKGLEVTSYKNNL